MGKSIFVGIPSCTQCGVCCLFCLCCLGEYGDDGLCKYLIPLDPLAKRTSCKKIEEGDLDDLVGSGCNTIAHAETYRIYFKNTEEMRKVLMEKFVPTV